MSAVFPYIATGLGGFLSIGEFEVTRVRLAPSGLAPPSFEHIELLELSDGTVRSRDQVVADIRRGSRYYTNRVMLAPKAYLEVVERFNAFASRAYVRTRPDCTTLNNLLSLPRF